MTKRKLSIIDRLTAWCSYCVWLFSKLIDERSLDADGYGDFTNSDIAKVAQITKLSTGFIQKCRDQALWMWRAYRMQHGEWERKLNNAKGR